MWPNGRSTDIQLIELEGQLYRFTQLPFGLAITCKVYTVYKPLRLSGHWLSFYIYIDILMMHCLHLVTRYTSSPIAVYSRGFIFVLQDKLCNWEKCSFVTKHSAEYAVQVRAIVL